MVLSNDIEALEHVLDACGYGGELVGDTPRQSHVALFYRNELRDHLLAEQHKTDGPLTWGQLARLVYPCESKDAREGRLLTEVTRRIGCALRKMRVGRVARTERTQAGQVWRLARTIVVNNLDKPLI